MAKVKEQTKPVSKISDEQIMRIIERVESGESERAACRAEDVHRATFRAAALRSKVDAQYARALEGLAMAQVEELEKTIEDMRSGKIDAQMARVEVDARKWFASKFLPKRFGDSLDVTTKGEKLPTPILGDLSALSSNDSDPQDSPTQEEN